MHQLSHCNHFDKFWNTYFIHFLLPHNTDYWHIFSFLLNYFNFVGYLYMFFSIKGIKKCRCHPNINWFIRIAMLIFFQMITTTPFLANRALVVSPMLFVGNKIQHYATHSFSWDKFHHQNLFFSTCTPCLSGLGLAPKWGKVVTNWNTFNN